MRGSRRADPATAPICWDMSAASDVSAPSHQPVPTEEWCSARGAPSFVSHGGFPRSVPPEAMLARRDPASCPLRLHQGRGMMQAPCQDWDRQALGLWDGHDSADPQPYVIPVTRFQDSSPQGNILLSSPLWVPISQIHLITCHRWVVLGSPWR